MSERVTQFEENLPEEQVAGLYEQAERLSRIGTLRFGGAGEGSYGAKPNNRVRYCADRELVTVLRLSGDIFGLAEEDMPWLDIAIETPLPPTQRWPNTYVRHDFTVPRGGKPSTWVSEETYIHRLSVARYTKSGELDEEVEEKLVSDLLKSTDDEAAMGVILAEAVDTFTEEQLTDLRRTYPDYAYIMRPNWTPDYCCERLAWLAGLTEMDEVGCLPNPYIRE